tara:strand:+ start:885 stop:1112 length:228 start_codon:yes stop_codon:yes gene_type:complete
VVNTNKYRVWVEHRLVHAIEVVAGSAEEAQDKVYEQQLKGTYCSKHNKSEKITCQKIIELMETEIKKDRSWVADG